MIVLVWVADLSDSEFLLNVRLQVCTLLLKNLEKSSWVFSVISECTSRWKLDSAPRKLPILAQSSESQEQFGARTWCKSTYNLLGDCSLTTSNFASVSSRAKDSNPTYEEYSRKNDSRKWQKKKINSVILMTILWRQLPVIAPTTLAVFAVCGNTRWNEPQPMPNHLKKNQTKYRKKPLKGPGLI